MSALFTILIPLYGVIALGWLAGATKVMGTNAAQVLSRFVFLFAMPIAVFGFFAAAPPPDVEVLPMMAAYALAAAIMMAASGIAAYRHYRLSVPEAGAHAFASTCGNAIFLGLPIALALPGWGQPFLMLMLIEGSFVYGAGIALFQWTDDPGDSGPKRIMLSAGRAVFRSLRTPMMIGVFSGLILSLTGISLPGPVADFARFFGATAAPMGLFVLGLYIAALPRGDISNFLGPVAMAGAAKLLAFPLLTCLLVGLATGWDMRLVSIATFFTALPPAVSSIVQASHFGVYERRIAAILIVLTPVSLITITLLLMALAPKG